MKCVILQPSYIPWRGVFDQILQADVFVFYDDVQYDKHGWRNRNRVKTPQGTQWLTIPVRSGGAVLEHTPINAIEIDHRLPWARKHWATLQQAYARAPYFSHYAPLLADFYARQVPLLADFTIDLTIALAAELGVSSGRFRRASQLGVTGSQTGRLAAICQSLGADQYLSGPSARDYLQPECFAAAGIQLQYVHYDYPEYSQLHPPYDPQVSILDLLFMTGPQAREYIQPQNEHTPG